MNSLDHSTHNLNAEHIHHGIRLSRSRTLERSNNATTNEIDAKKQRRRQPLSTTSVPQNIHTPARLPATHHACRRAVGDCKPKLVQIQTGRYEKVATSSAAVDERSRGPRAKGQDLPTTQPQFPQRFSKRRVRISNSSRNAAVSCRKKYPRRAVTVPSQT